MTLIKSILLGSAAGIVAVASAQAADLPTKKAAPVAEYVKICNVGGITGWTLPGSDTCVKLSGYMTAQFEGGNLSNQYNWGTSSTSLVGTNATVGGRTFLTPSGASITIPNALAYGQRVLVQGNSNQNNATFNRDATGWTTRANFGFDFASNTAYGPLIGHMDFNVENSNGFDRTGGGLLYLNTGYVTWAGITAGKAPSFFSFIGGGPNWANVISPDQKGFNQPDLIAYTASFGGGFSATIAAQSPGGNGANGNWSGNGTQMGYPWNGTLGGNQGWSLGGTNSFNPVNIEFGGQRWPDIVGQLNLKQGWGEAQLSGVIHNVNVAAYDYTGTAGEGACGVLVAVNCNAQETKTGWGLDAGVKFYLPSFGTGDFFVLTGAYTQNAVWYSGIPDAMWGENGQTNGNGQPMYVADAFFNPLTNQWSSPTAWSVTAWLEHHFSPQFYVDLVGSVAGLHWSNQGGGCNFANNIVSPGLCSLYSVGNGAISPSATTWLVGADIGWVPVTNLNFDLELMYEATNQEKPSGFLGTVYNYGTANQVLVPGDWRGNSAGFAGRLRVTRYF